MPTSTTDRAPMAFDAARRYAVGRELRSEDRLSRARVAADDDDAAARAAAVDDAVHPLHARDDAANRMGLCLALRNLAPAHVGIVPHGIIVRKRRFSVWRRAPRSCGPLPEVRPRHEVYRDAGYFVIALGNRASPGCTRGESGHLLQVDLHPRHERYQMTRARKPK